MPRVRTSKFSEKRDDNTCENKKNSGKIRKSYVALKKLKPSDLERKTRVMSSQTLGQVSEMFVSIPSPPSTESLASSPESGDEAADVVWCNAVKKVTRQLFAVRDTVNRNTYYELCIAKTEAGPTGTISEVAEEKLTETGTVASSDSENAEMMERLHWETETSNESPEVAEKQLTDTGTVASSDSENAEMMQRLHWETETSNEESNDAEYW